MVDDQLKSVYTRNYVIITTKLCYFMQRVFLGDLSKKRHEKG